ncbi:MAG: hypothetical protein ACKVHE_12150, partial [Planctomycetales bacterium]
AIVDDQEHFWLFRVIKNLCAINPVVHLGLLLKQLQTVDDCLLGVRFNGCGRRYKRLLSRWLERVTLFRRVERWLLLEKNGAHGRRVAQVESNTQKIRVQERGSIACIYEMLSTR